MNKPLVLLATLSVVSLMPVVAHAAAPLARSSFTPVSLQDRDRDQDRDQDKTRDQDRDKDQDKDQDRDRDRLRDRDRDQIYGYDLMTEQERIAYRNQMRTLATEQEREAFRKQHHALMQQRARERGVKIPDEPGSMGQAARRQAEAQRLEQQQRQRQSVPQNQQRMQPRAPLSASGVGRASAVEGRTRAEPPASVQPMAGGAARPAP